MIEPLLYQIEFSFDPNIFNRNNFVKEFKSGWITEWNKYNQQRKAKGKPPLPIPAYHYLFSFEYKGTGKNKEGRIIIKQYHHCHFYFIVDNNHHKYGIEMLVNRSINVFKGIKGINQGKNEAGQSMNPRVNYKLNSNTTPIDMFEELRCHHLKTEFHDAFKRVSYISKLNQKEGVPFPITFGSSIRSVNKCNSLS